MLIEKHGSDNPLFHDDLYLQAIETAMTTECQKLGFGVLVIHKGKIVAKTSNKPMDITRHICQPRCIRFDIPSRTESMLGACNHAEEWALDAIRDLGLNPSECVFYEAGIYPNGKPWIKPDASFSCVRCANQMYRARLGGIFVAVVDRWVSVPVDTLMKEALPFATLQKKV